MKPGEKRLFLALSVRSPLPESFQQMQKKLHITCDKKGLDVNWTPPSGLHITVKFLGEVEKEKLNQIEEITESALRNHQPFSIKLRGVGGFPDLRQARVLWAGVQAKRDLRDLKSSLETSMEELGFFPDTFEFTPHITLGRLRNKKSITDVVSPFIRGKWGEIEVDSVSLFESQMGGYFPVYNILRDFHL